MKRDAVVLFAAFVAVGVVVIGALVACVLIVGVQ